MTWHSDIVTVISSSTCHKIFSATQVQCYTSKGIILNNVLLGNILFSISKAQPEVICYYCTEPRYLILFLLTQFSPLIFFKSYIVPFTFWGVCSDHCFAGFKLPHCSPKGFAVRIVFQKLFLDPTFRYPHDCYAELGTSLRRIRRSQPSHQTSTLCALI